MLLLSFFLFYFFFKTYLSFYPFSFYLTSFAWFLLSLFFYYFTTPTLPSIYGSHRSFLKLSLPSLSLTSSLIFFYSTSPTFFPQTVASMGAPLSSLSPLFSHHGGHGSHDHGALSLSSLLSPLFLSSLLPFSFSHLSFFPNIKGESYVAEGLSEFCASVKTGHNPHVLSRSKILILHSLVDYKIRINYHQIIVNNLSQTNKLNV